MDAITNFQHTRAEGDDLIVEDLVEDALQKSSEELKNAKVIALSEPFLIKQLISENANVTGVNVTLQFPEESINRSSGSSWVCKKFSCPDQRRISGH